MELTELEDGKLQNMQDGGIPGPGAKTAQDCCVKTEQKLELGNEEL